MMASDSSLKGWTALALLRGIPSGKIWKWLETQDSRRIPPTTNRVFPDLFRFCNLLPGCGPDPNQLLEDAAKEISRTDSEDFEIIAFDDPAYPTLLKNIYDPPFVLFVRGDVRLLNTPALAIVGMRQPTEYGREVTRQLTTGIVDHGLTVVSGLAMGIDAEAHRSAINNGGSTIAVLGCGLNQAYPVCNREVRKDIESKGLVVTEFPWNTTPKPGNFPRRNRIISGLSLGTLLIEAGERSGALHTINHALEQGREVFAVPGAITSPASRGPLLMIQQGAVPVLQVADIIDHLPGISQVSGLDQPELPVHMPDIDHSLQPLWNLLSSVPVQIDDLIVGSGLPAPAAHSALLEFELRGWIKQLPGKQYLKTVRRK